jgi:arginyl-tRNA synthetase
MNSEPKSQSDTSIESFTISAIREHLEQRARQALQAVGVEEPEVDLAPAPNPEMGDYGFPCFKLARVLRKAPPKIAAEVAEKIPLDELIGDVIVEKAYVNFRLRPEALIEIVLRQAIAKGDRFGADQVDAQSGTQKKVMVEYSSPNTNKPLHLGHLRNNLLGAAVARLQSFVGHDVTRVNLVNDRGVHICKSMLAYKRWGDGETPESATIKGDHLVGKYYVEFDKRFSEEYCAWKKTEAAEQRFDEWKQSPAGKGVIAAAIKEAADAAKKKHKQNEGADAADAADAATNDAASIDEKQLFFASYKDDYFNNDSALGREAREMLLAWEREDPEVRGLWRQMNDWVLSGFDQSYERMGVGFELTQFESDTYKLGKALVEDGLSRGVLKKRDDGATVCELEKVGLTGEKVLLRSDGTSVYMTQDLGTALERFDKYELDQLVYVVGDEQIYHFDVLFRILGLLRSGLSERCHHLAYGMIRLPEGKMKSREGTVVDADDLMNEMHFIACAEINTRMAEGKAHNEDLSDEEVELRAERIGMAALKYYLLKYSPKSSFEYNPEESIDFLGQTGPYALFNYARTRSLLRKAVGDSALAFDANAVRRLGSEQELGIIKQLASWPEVVTKAAEAYDPSRITGYIFELCRAFAFIFTDKANHPIATCEDVELRKGRLLLAQAVGDTVKGALGLLGIDVLEEM